MTQPAIIRAHVALKELREAMEDVRQVHPVYLTGQGPSAADNCRNILDFVDHGISQLATYIGIATEPYEGLPANPDHGPEPVRVTDEMIARGADALWREKAWAASRDEVRIILNAALGNTAQSHRSSDLPLNFTAAVKDAETVKVDERTCDCPPNLCAAWIPPEFCRENIARLAALPQDKEGES